MIRLSGRFRSALIIGGQGIRARKTRTLLSMVSLFLGVLAVVVVQVGAETAKSARLADLELHMGKDGTRQMYLQGSPSAIRVSQETLAGRPDALAIIGLQAIIGEPNVTPINPGGAPFDQPGGYGGTSYSMQCDQNGNCWPVPMDGQNAAAPVTGAAIELSLSALTGDIRQFRPFRPVAGDWLDFSTGPSLSPGIVVNLEAAKGFSRNRVPAEMRITGATANPTPRIIGVVDDGNPQPTAYGRADELGNWLPTPTGSGNSGPGLQIMLAPTALDAEQRCGSGWWPAESPPTRCTPRPSRPARRSPRNWR